MDKEFECVMVPVEPKILRSQTWSISGTRIILPSNELLVLEDGSIYILARQIEEQVEYVSLKEFIKQQTTF